MKQRSIREYTGSPLQDYNIVSTEWLGKSSNHSPISTKIKTRSYKSKSQKTIKSPPRSGKSFIENSPFGKWIQHTNNPTHKEDKCRKYTSKLNTNQITLSDSCPDVDDILKNINSLNQEAKLLEECNNILKENDISASSSLEEILDSTGKGTNSSKNIKTRSSSSKFRNKNKTKRSQKPVTEVISPLQKWLHRKSSKFQNKDKNVSELKAKPFVKSDSFEKYGVILPTVDDILKNMDSMKEEGRILDNYDDLFEESDISIPSSLKVSLDSPEKISNIPLLTCEHLSKLDLKQYFTKYLNYVKNVSEGLEFCQRHQTYKDHNSRSKLTYSFSTVVFTESQLEYLMKKIEKALDPEEKHTEYLFMVILPELCLRICMDEFDMSKEEAVDYLNQRPID